MVIQAAQNVAATPAGGAFAPVVGPQSAGPMGVAPAMPLDAHAALSVLGVPSAMIAAKRFDRLPPTALHAAVAGAGALRGIIDTGLAGATAAGQRIGFELEVCPDPTANAARTRLDRRDEMYEHVADFLRAPARGYRVELLTGAAPTFQLAANEHLYPVINDLFAFEGREVRIQRFRGHGAVLLTVNRGDGAEPTKTKLEGFDDVFSAADHVKTLARELLGVRDADAQRMTHQTHYMLMTKDLTGDTAKVWIAMERTSAGDLVAIVTAENGRFYPPDVDHPMGNPARDGALETVTVPIYSAAELAELGMESMRDIESEFHLAMSVLERLVEGRVLMQKINRYIGVRIYGFGGDPDAYKDFRIGDEEHPYVELISPILTATDFPIAADVVAAFAEQGYVGTLPEHTIGMHMHLDLPLTVDGRCSIAPALRIARAFLEHRAAFYSVIPVETNRLPYIAAMAPELAARVMDDTYVKDPTDAVTMLRVMQDFVTRTDGKYHDINLENYFAALIREMVCSGLLTVGAALETKDERGEPYRFRVVLDGTTGDPNVLYQVAGETYAPLARMSTHAPITTAELRFPNTIHQETAPGQYAVDPQSVVYLLQLGAAFGFLYGSN